MVMITIRMTHTRPMIEQIFIFCYKHLEEAAGSVIGLAIILNTGIKQKFVDETIHSIFAVVTAIIVVIVTHIMKVEFAKWYKVFKDKLKRIKSIKRKTP